MNFIKIRPTRGRVMNTSPERYAALLRESVNALFALVCLGLFIATVGLWAVIIADKIQ